MKLRDLFQRLSYGDLSNLKIGMNGQGSIDPDYLLRIVVYAETALTALYTRFSHKSDYVTLKQSEGVLRYRLSTNHAATNTDETDTSLRFLLDTEAEPFTGNVLKIVSVQEADPDIVGDQPYLLINDSANTTRSAKLLSYDTLYFPEPVADRLLTVEYQALHPAFSRPLNANEEIILHPALNQALEKKIAAQVYGAMNGQENLVKAQSLEGEYETICQAVTAQDLVQLGSTDERQKLVLKGFI